MQLLHTIPFFLAIIILKLFHKTLLMTKAICVSGECSFPSFLSFLLGCTVKSFFYLQPLSCQQMLHHTKPLCCTFKNKVVGRSLHNQTSSTKAKEPGKPQAIVIQFTQISLPLSYSAFQFVLIPQEDLTGSHSIMHCKV